MLNESGYPSFVDEADFAERQAEIAAAGEALANFFYEQEKAGEKPRLLLDMDGVVFKGDGLQFPILAALDTIPALQLLESLGVELGTATSRNHSVIDYLHYLGLQMKAPLILDSGQLLSVDGETKYLVPQEHLDFITKVKEGLAADPNTVKKWKEVRASAAKGHRRKALGNFQWSNDSLLYAWAHYDDTADKQTEQGWLEAQMNPIITHAAVESHFPMDRIYTSTFFMQPHPKLGNAMMMKITGLDANGMQYTKASAAEKIAGRWAYIADGPGDKEMGQLTKTRGGMTIAIKKSIDVDSSGDSASFFASADARIRNARDFARTIRYAATALAQKRKGV